MSLSQDNLVPKTFELKIKMDKLADYFNWMNIHFNQTLCIRGLQFSILKLNKTDGNLLLFNKKMCVLVDMLQFYGDVSLIIMEGVSSVSTSELTVNNETNGYLKMMPIK